MIFVPNPPVFGTHPGHETLSSPTHNACADPSLPCPYLATQLAFLAKYLRLLFNCLVHHSDTDTLHNLKVTYIGLIPFLET